MRKSGWFSVAQGLSYLTQVGLSVATPIVLLLLLASWLVQRVGLGAWVYLPALVLGLGAAACSFAGFARHMLRKSAAKASAQTTAQGQAVSSRGTNDADAPIYVPPRIELGKVGKGAPTPEASNAPNAHKQSSANKAGNAQNSRPDAGERNRKREENKHG